MQLELTVDDSRWYHICCVLFVYQHMRMMCVRTHCSVYTSTHQYSTSLYWSRRNHISYPGTTARVPFRTVHAMQSCLTKQTEFLDIKESWKNEISKIYQPITNNSNSRRIQLMLTHTHKPPSPLATLNAIFFSHSLNHWMAKRQHKLTQKIPV